MTATSIITGILAPFEIVAVSLKFKDVKRAFVVSFATFTLVYMIASGMVFKASPPLPTRSLVDFDLAVGRPIGLYPWVTIVFKGNIVFSMNLTAGVSLAILSVLFAFNIGALFYARKYVGECCKVSGPGQKSIIASALPAMFSTFACCGGGLSLAIFSYLLSLGVGSAYAAVFVSKGWILTLVSATLLYFNLYRLSRQITTSSAGLRVELPKRNAGS